MNDMNRAWEHESYANTWFLFYIFFGAFCFQGKRKS